MIISLIISLLLSFPRVISDKRPLPATIKETEKTARELTSGSRVYEIKFENGDTVLTESGDTVRPPRFSGYDKGLNSAKESFFVTNTNGNTLREFTVEITYLTMDGKMLHKRSVTKQIDVPTGETRRIDIPTWDTQHQFHYQQTDPAPKRRSTPFRVRMRTLRASYE